MSAPATHPVKRLVVFPNDPLYKYHDKGEIKDRYWNPCSIFDEVHVISLADREVEPHQVASLAGKGRLFIHTLGRPTAWQAIRRSDLLSRAIATVEPLGATLFRAHNPSLQGWLATRCAQVLGVPSVISIHCDLSRPHFFRIIGPGYAPRFLRSLGERILFEPHVFAHADLVLGAYAYPLQYIRRFRDNGVDTVYNKVYGRQFAGPRRDPERFRILSVGRHIPGKNPMLLIRAIRDLDAELVLIGTGPLTPKARRLASDLGVNDRVEFIDAVPNSEIHHQYLEASAFAIAIRYAGICIPVLEAMAAGLPVVVPKPLWEEEPELIGDAALAVDYTPEGFRAAFSQLMADPDRAHHLGERGRAIHRTVDGELMERREAEMLLELIG